MNNNYNNNRQHQHAHQQGANNNQLNPSPQDAANKLPYGFVPVGDARIKRDPRIDLGKYNRELYTGYINCSTYALNELCVGNSHKDLGNDRTAILPLMVDGTILISAHTLKGCIANFLAAHLKLPITRMNNHRYSFRPNNAFGSNICFGAGIVEKINSDGSLEVRKFKDDKFAYTRNKNKDGYYSYQVNNNKYSYLRPDMNGDYFKFYDYFDGLDGSGTMANLFANSGTTPRTPPSHKGFGVKLSSPTDYPLSTELFLADRDTVKLYTDTIDVLMDDKIGHLCDHPLTDTNDVSTIKNNLRKHLTNKEGDLVFFEYRNGTKQILTFGKHFRYRWAYSRSLHDFQQDYQPYDLDALRKANTNIIEELFGYSYGEKEITSDKDIPFENRAKSGKVHFSFAEHVSGTGQLKTEKWLPRPGSPKPSSFEFYLRENYRLFLNRSTLQGCMVTNGDPARKDFKQAPRLSGRKFYYKTVSNSYQNGQGVAGEDMTVRLSDVLHPSESSFPQFNFRVHYHNLSLNELHLLHFALCLGQNAIPNLDRPLSEQNILCHQIGYGKNFGMGAVKFVINTVNDKEEVFRIKVDSDTGKLELYRLKIEQKHTLSKDMKRLMTLGEQFRTYPRYEGKIHLWHTKLKNDDLKARRE